MSSGIQWFGEKIQTLKRVGPVGAYHRLMYKWVGRERHMRYGSENPEHTFYVIRGIDHECRHYCGVPLNLLAIHSYVLSHLLYAEEKGYLPIIDQRNDPVNNRKNGPDSGADNPWEYFWHQPIPYSLEEVYRSRHVVLSKRSWYEPGNLGFSVEAHQNAETIRAYHRLSAKAPLNEETQRYIGGWKERLFPNRGKILGVALRRGGYAKADSWHAPDHPIQPEPEELAEIVAKRLEEWGMDSVFLTTEEGLYIDLFRGFFGDRLICLPRVRYHGCQDYPAEEDPLYRSGQRYQTALDYLTEMELLAACDGLIGSITSGLRYAIIQNNGSFEHVEILDCGRYPPAKK